MHWIHSLLWLASACLEFMLIFLFVHWRHPIQGNICHWYLPSFVSLYSIIYNPVSSYNTCHDLAHDNASSTTTVQESAWTNLVGFLMGPPDLSRHDRWCRVNLFLQGSMQIIKHWNFLLSDYINCPPGFYCGLHCNAVSPLQICTVVM